MSRSELCNEPLCSLKCGERTFFSDTGCSKVDLCVSAINARCQLNVLERHTLIHYVIKEVINLRITKHHCLEKFVSLNYEVTHETNVTLITLYVGLKSLE